MSQKTNPTSLRLQKNNQNFSLPGFADFFFTENYHYGLEIENYLAPFLRQTRYSKAFFSARNQYKDFSIFVFLQDSRADEKEKQLFFKYKSSSSSKPSKEYSLTAVKEMLDNGIISEVPGTRPKRATLSHSSLPKKIESKKVVDNFFPLSCANFDCNAIPLSKGMQNNYAAIKRKSVDLDLLKVKQRVSFAFAKGEEQEARRNLNSKAFSSLQDEKKGSSISSRDLHLRKIVSSSLLSNQGLAFSNKKSSCFNSRYSKLKAENSKVYGDESKIRLLSFQCLSSKLIPSISQSLDCTKGFNPPLLRNSVYEHDKITKKSKIEYFTKSTSLSLSGNSLFTSPDVIKTGIPFFGTAITVQPIRYIRDRQSVMSLLNQIVILLEKRVAFRQLKSFLLKDLSKDPQIKGVRFLCSGRLGGRSKKAQKSKTQSASWGTTSLSAFSSKLLFGSKSAYTSYGKVGIKLWVCFKNNRC